MEFPKQQYNKKIRLEPFTYIDALKLCYKVIDEKRQEIDKADIHKQNLSADYQLTLQALSDLFLHGWKPIQRDNESRVQE